MEAKRTAVLVPNPQTPCMPITFDFERCVGCNTCVNVCRTDVLMPNPEKGKPPVVVYPDECWFCGCCVEDCPVEGASVFHHPLNMKPTWKRRDTQALYRVEMEGCEPPFHIREYD